MTAVTSVRVSRDTGAGRTTSYTYNQLGQTTKIVHPYETTEEDRLGSEEFDYYESGALKWKQERDDMGSLSKTYFEYDDLGRRTGTDYAYDGTFDGDVSFEYEGGSELVTTVHEAGGLGDTVYAYDDLGRLKSYEPPKPSGFATWYKLEYEYNTLGAKTKMTLTLPSGAKKYTRYAYRRDGNVWNVMWPTPSWPPTVMSQYLYFKNGLPKWTVYGQIDASSYRTLYGYDTQNRATSVEHFHRTSSPWNGAKMASRSATLDEQGNPTAIDEWHDAQTTFHNTYSYDDFSRLTSWSLEGQQQDAWTYDRVGNWTMSGWTADPKADMLTASPGSKTYTYTPRGSLEEGYANQQQAQTFGYDAEGLLTFKSDIQQSRVSLMGWDHAGRRIELTPNGGTPWRFIYDPTASVPAVVVEDLNGTPQAFYVREPDGRLIAREAGESLQYYFFDLLGSTILMAPATEGNPTDRFYYTPWGQTVTTGSRASTIATTANPYRFVGSLGYYTHHQDANLADWMQLGVRFYQPEIGRFERRDPIASYLGSDFLYGGARPTLMVDPSGMVCFRCWRELEGMWNYLALGEQMHSFLWCADGIARPGNRKGRSFLDYYDPNDAVIGMGSDSYCWDFDRQYLSNSNVARAYGLTCTELDPALEKCLKRRAAHDMHTQCFGKYNAAFNNCQEYTQDMISDCKAEVAPKAKPRPR